LANKIPPAFILAIQKAGNISRLTPLPGFEHHHIAVNLLHYFSSDALKPWSAIIHLKLDGIVQFLQNIGFRSR
jgi:hypothetical protein